MQSDKETQKIRIKNIATKFYGEALGEPIAIDIDKVANDAFDYAENRVLPDDEMLNEIFYQLLRAEEDKTLERWLRILNSTRWRVGHSASANTAFDGSDGREKFRLSGVDTGQSATTSPKSPKP